MAYELSSSSRIARMDGKVMRESANLPLAAALPTSREHPAESLDRKCFGVMAIEQKAERELRKSFGRSQSGVIFVS